MPQRNARSLCSSPPTAHLLERRLAEAVALHVELRARPLDAAAIARRSSSSRRSRRGSQCASAIEAVATPPVAFLSLLSPPFT